MMHLLGTDLVEIARIQKVMRRPRFLSRVLGEQEYTQLKERGFPAESIAASFCAKEAFAKAMGTGLCSFGLREVQVVRDEAGKPHYRFSGRAALLMEGKTAVLSLTHTRQYASAVALISDH